MRTFFIHIVLSVALAYLLLQVVPFIHTNAFYGVLALLVSLIFLWLFTYFIHQNYFYKAMWVTDLFLYFIMEMLKANLLIASDILTPNYKLEPAVFALPLDVKSDFEITMLAVLITLTPGSLSIDLTPDKKYLYVHSLYHYKGQEEKKIAHIKNGFEQKLLRITR